MWAILVMTLPTQPNAVRVRVWRALKAMGCAALRDGAYLLPSAAGGAVRAAGRRSARARRRGHAAHADRRATTRSVDELLRLVRPQRCLRAVARHRDRTACRTRVARRGRSAPAPARRWPTRCRRCSRIDYYPGAAAAQAQADLASAAPGARGALLARASRSRAVDARHRASRRAGVSAASAGRRARGRGSTGSPAPG